MENYRRNICELFSTVKPLFYMSKLLGFAPVSVTSLLRKEKILVKKSFCKRSDSLYSSIIILLIAFITVFVFLKIVISNAKNKELDGHSMYFLDLLIIGMTTIINLTVPLLKFPEEIYKVFHKLSLVGEYLKMKDKGFANNAKFIRAQIGFVVIFYFTICLVDIFIWYRCDYYWNLYITMEDIFSFLEVIVIIQFIDFVFVIKKCIQEINKSLIYSEMIGANSLTENQWKLLNEMHTFLNDHVNCKQQNLSNDISYVLYYKYSRKMYEWPCISALRLMQDTLCDLSSSVNSMYGLQMLFIFVTNFIQVTSNLNYFIIAISRVSKLNIQELALCLSSMFWALENFTLLFCIVVVCSSASKESEHTADLLQKLLLMPEIKQTAMAEIQQFTQQVMIRRIHFTAYDFFTLNYNILVSIIGAVTTFLVIIVQFQHSV